MTVSADAQLWSSNTGKSVPANEAPSDPTHCAAWRLKYDQNHFKTAIVHIAVFSAGDYNCPFEAGATRATGTTAAPPEYSGQGAPLTAEELQQLVAPIALYPDSLVAQILGAATFPDQVDAAAGWLQQNRSSRATI